MAPSRKTTGSRQAGHASARRAPGKILDLFAGAGGWEEALRMLGLNALGIETEPWAGETARAAGHERLQADVQNSTLTSSHPCGGWSDPRRARRTPPPARGWAALISHW